MDARAAASTRDPRSCSSPARAASARPRSPARPPSASPSAGRRVLLVSTDPASNLDEVLGDDARRRRRARSPASPASCALNIDPEAAARAYRERMVGPVPRRAARRRRARASRSSSRAPAPWRSPRSTSSPRCSADAERHARASTTSSSTRRRPGTRCGCSRCRPPGPGSSTRTSAAPRASARSPGSSASRRSTPSTRRRPGRPGAHHARAGRAARADAPLAEAERTRGELAALGMRQPAARR